MTDLTLAGGLGRTLNYGATRRQLNALSDAQLNDIGITRGQIDDVASGLVQRGARAIRGRFASRGMSVAPLFRAFISL